MSKEEGYKATLRETEKETKFIDAWLNKQPSKVSRGKTIKAKRADFYHKAVAFYMEHLTEQSDQSKANRVINGLKIAKSHAKSKGGECLSTEYKNARSPMTWKCANGSHPAWEASYNRVITGGNWCPECGKNNLCESAIRTIFEIAFNKSFPSSRPDWLVNPATNRRLELDGYNQELGIAFEHNGPHHFDHKQHFFDIGKERLEVQSRRDDHKRKACVANEVLLVSIPWNRNFYKKTTEGRRDFIDHIYICCTEAGLTLPKINKSGLRAILKNLK